MVVPFSASVIESNSTTFSVEVDAYPFPDSVAITTPSQYAVAPYTTLNETAGSAMIIFTTLTRFNTGSYSVTMNNSVGSSSVVFDIEVYCEFIVQPHLY